MQKWRSLLFVFAQQPLLVFYHNKARPISLSWWLSFFSSISEYTQLFFVHFLSQQTRSGWLSMAVCDTKIERTPSSGVEWNLRYKRCRLEVQHCVVSGGKKHALNTTMRICIHITLYVKVLHSELYSSILQKLLFNLMSVFFICYPRSIPPFREISVQLKTTIT